MKRVVVNFERRSRPETEKSSHPNSAILQNAETIRLVQSGRRAVSLTGLEEGSEALVCTEKGGRHFGVRMDKNIIDR